MKRSVYLQPTGLFWDRNTSPDLQPAGAGQHWRGLPLAGGGLSFAAIDVLTRTSAATTRRTVVLGDAFSGDWSREAEAASDLLNALTAPRGRIAGLALDRPRLMGIVNVTPDSFSDGGRHNETAAAVTHALKLADEGADILDIGGESTRPGSDAVALDEELRRVIPVIEDLRPRTDKLISIDTRKAEVMRRAALAGADILNDVSALTHDPDALICAVETGLPVMLMHAQGDPKTMNDDPSYGDAVLDVFDFLEQRIAACERAGIAKSKIIADPGIGFGKHLHHNVAVMAGLSLYHGLGVPLLLGASRKKMIGQIARVDAASDRLAGSLASAIAGASQGVQIFRVHDVAETRQALAVWQASLSGKLD